MVAIVEVDMRLDAIFYFIKSASGRFKDPHVLGSLTERMQLVD